MTDKVKNQILILDNATKKATSSKKQAKKFLNEAGIIKRKRKPQNNGLAHK